MRRTWCERLVRVCAGVLITAANAYADSPSAIARVKGSVVAVGTAQPLRNPAFRFLGTGFAVGDGTVIARNAHVIAAVSLGVEPKETFAVMIPSESGPARMRGVSPHASDPAHDIALLTLEGETLVPLNLRDSDGVREGDLFLFTGFPIGAVLGPHPATHRSMVAAITPIAIPSAGARRLDAHLVHQLASGAFPIFQLDATAYPGSSGSPLYDPGTAEVIGIINMAFVKGAKENALTQPSGIAYAIPARHLQALLGKLR